MSRFVIVGKHGYFNLQEGWVDELAYATVFSGSEKEMFDRLPADAEHWAELLPDRPGHPRRLDDYRDAPPGTFQDADDNMIDIGAIVDDLRDTARQLVVQLGRDEIDPDFLHAMQVFFSQLAAAIEDHDGVETKSGVYHEAGRLRGYVLPESGSGYAVIFEIAPEEQIKELARLAAQATDNDNT